MSFSASVSMPLFKNKEEYEKYCSKNKGSITDLLNVTYEDNSTFEYEVTIPETTAQIKISKDQIVDDIENRIERSLSDEEKNKVWNDFCQSDDFRDVFAYYFRERGYPCQGAQGLDYATYFEEAVETAIQDTINECFSECWKDFFGNSLEEIADDIKKSDNTNTVEDKITWENIESHTQTRIQDENVKNGLARCKRELKKTSIKKWKENYISTNIINSNIVLPKGKSKDDLVQNIIDYLK
jgi:hypothetical protein